MQNNNAPGIGEKVIAYVTLFVYVLLALFVGLSEIITFILLPALFAYMLLRFGVEHMLLHCAVVIAAYSFAAGEFSMAVLPAVLSGVCIGICFVNLKSLRFTVGASVLTMLASEVLNYFIEMLRADAPMQFMESFTAQSSDLISQLGLPTKESAMILQILEMYRPTILIMSFAMLSYAVVFVLLSMLRKRVPVLAAQYPRFRDLSAGGGTMLIWGISWIVAAVDKGAIGIAFANLGAILSSYIVICGFSILTYWITKIRAGGLRVLLCIVMFWMFSILTPAAFALGVSDTIFRFRLRKRGDQDEK